MMTNPTSSGEDFGRINEPEGSFGDSNKDSSTDQPFRKRGATMPSSAYGQRPGRSQRVNDDHFTLSSSGQSSNDDIQEFDCGAARRYYRLRSYSVTGRVVSRCGEVLRSRPLHERMGYGINLTPLAARSAGLQSTARCLVRTMSHGSSSSDKSSTDSAIPFTSRYQVAVLGGPAVGKRSLISQFISSDYDRNSGPDVLECDVNERVKTPVSILLDGEESELQFLKLDTTCHIPPEEFVFHHNVDAYVIVYSVSDRVSFTAAVQLLNLLQAADLLTEHAVILVANKIDLERVRCITAEEGRETATSYGCKFIETSEWMNHNMDDLLVGILSQIRLKKRHQRSTYHLRRQDLWDTGDAGGNDICKEQRKPVFRRSRSIVRELLKKLNFNWTSCDDLHVL